MKYHIFERILFSENNNSIVKLVRYIVLGA